jgi:hypothetical protein
MSARRILVVAHRSVATPVLLEEIQRHAEAGDCTFELLIPDAADGAAAEWTLRRALPLLKSAAGAPVEGIVARGRDPFRAIELALRDGAYDEIILSTLPRRVSTWLRRDLPTRVRRLGVPTTVVTPVERRSRVVS